MAVKNTAQVIIGGKIITLDVYKRQLYRRVRRWRIWRRAADFPEIESRNS